MLNVANKYHYAERRYADCRYAECRGACFSIFQLPEKQKVKRQFFLLFWFVSNLGNGLKETHFLQFLFWVLFCFVLLTHCFPIWNRFLPTQRYVTMKYELYFKSVTQSVTHLIYFFSLFLSFLLPSPILSNSQHKNPKFVFSFYPNLIQTYELVSISCHALPNTPVLLSLA